MTYREMAVEALKLAGEELINRADSLIPNAERVEQINVWVRIPSLSDNALEMPTIEVETDVAPTSFMLDKFLSLKLGRTGGETDDCGK